jgi:hypothetical protein
MKKVFFLFIALLMSMVSFAAEERLPMAADADLGSGWNSSYDAATQTITYTAGWSGRGWWFGDGKGDGEPKDCSAYTKVVAEFEATNSVLKLVVEYAGSETMSELIVNAGQTQIVVDLDPTLKSAVSQVWFQKETAGTVVLVDVYFTDGNIEPPAKENLPMGNLDSGGANSSYNAATQTITFLTAWTNRGWWLGSKDCSNYTQVVVEFEAVGFNVQLVVEYVDGTSGSTTVNAGATSVVVVLDKTAKGAVKQIYLQSSEAGELTLSEAYIEKAIEVIEPEDRENLPMAQNSDLNGGWGGTSYNAATKTITFIEEWTGRGWWLTSKNCSEFVQVVVEFEPVEYEVVLVVEYVSGPSNETRVAAGETSVVVDLNPASKNAVKQIYLHNSAVGTLTLSEAYLLKGEGTNISNVINSSAIAFYAGNTLFLNGFGAVQIYGINGSILLAKQNVSSLDLSALGQGVYIAKAIVNGQTQVVKILK